MKTIIHNQYKTTEWSGGKTTELFIYPEGGNYRNGDFLARVSTATVEVESSDFTKLPGVYRMLMVLEGQMTLNIGANDPLNMAPYDICAFKGDIETKSVGKVRDFNLMVKDNMAGDVSFLGISRNNIINFPRSLGRQILVIYVIGGKGTLNGEAIQHKDTIVLEDYEGEVCELQNAQEESLNLAVCRLWEKEDHR